MPWQGHGAFLGDNDLRQHIGYYLSNVMSSYTRHGGVAVGVHHVGDVVSGGAQAWTLAMAALG
jgi:hypothetical protein